MFKYCRAVLVHTTGVLAAAFAGVLISILDSAEENRSRLSIETMLHWSPVLPAFAVSPPTALECVLL